MKTAVDKFQLLPAFLKVRVVFLFLWVVIVGVVRFKGIGGKVSEENRSIGEFFVLWWP